MKFQKIGMHFALLAAAALFLASFIPHADAGYGGVYRPAAAAFGRTYYYTRDLSFITTRPTATAAPESVPAVSASPSPQTTPSAAAALTQGEASQMLAWINEDRAREGLSPLSWDADLDRAALAHSQDMAQGQYCSHDSPTRGGFSARLRASGIAAAGAGENVARYGNLQKAHAALMASPSHRSNLMNERYTHIGIGIVRDAQGVYFITQWIARLP